MAISLPIEQPVANVTLLKVIILIVVNLMLFNGQSRMIMTGSSDVIVH